MHRTDSARFLTVYHIRENDTRRLSDRKSTRLLLRWQNSTSPLDYGERETTKKEQRSRGIMVETEWKIEDVNNAPLG